MSLQPFRAPAWFLATTLAERLATLRTLPPRQGLDDSGRARQRLDRWRAQPPFRGTDFFSQRLSVGGLLEDELLHLLGEPADAVAARAGAPAWLAEVEQAYAGLDGWDAAALPDERQEADNPRFL